MGVGLVVLSWTVLAPAENVRVSVYLYSGSRVCARGRACRCTCDCDVNVRTQAGFFRGLDARLRESARESARARARARAGERAREAREITLSLHAHNRITNTRKRARTHLQKGPESEYSQARSVPATCVCAGICVCLRLRYARGMLPVKSFVCAT